MSPLGASLMPPGRLKRASRAGPPSRTLPPPAMVSIRSNASAAPAGPYGAAHGSSIHNVNARYPSNLLPDPRHRDEERHSPLSLSGMDNASKSPLHLSAANPAPPARMAPD